MKEIILTQGKIALIDDEDFEMVSKHKWRLQKGRNTHYAITQIYHKRKMQAILMHRLILNPAENMDVDHINHNGWDNTRSNIRVCTKSQNCMNRNTHKGSSSIYKGVCWHKQCNKWRSRIRIHGKLIHLGDFHNEIDAAKAYNIKAVELFGEFAKLNIFK